MQPELVLHDFLAGLPSPEAAILYSPDFPALSFILPEFW